MTPAEELLAMLHHIAPDIDPATVDRTRPMADQLDLDSMDYQNFLAAIASRYSIEIPERDIPRLGTIDAIAEYVQAARR